MLRDDLIGIWRAHRSGLSLDSLNEALDDMRFWLRSDGTAEVLCRHAITDKWASTECTWDVIDEVDLIVTVPIAPMPDLGIYDWTSDDMCFRIMSAAEDELILDSHPFGGEVFTVYRRSEFAIS